MVIDGEIFGEVSRLFGVEDMMMVDGTGKRRRRRRRRHTRRGVLLGLSHRQQGLMRLHEPIPPLGPWAYSSTVAPASACYSGQTLVSCNVPAQYGGAITRN